MQCEEAPARRPQQKIHLPFYAVNVRKESRHQRRGDQQRNGNQSVVRQCNIHFRVRPADADEQASANHNVAQTIFLYAARAKMVRKSVWRHTSPAHYLRTRNYGARFFTCATVLGYWWPKRQRRARFTVTAQLLPFAV